MIEKNKAPSLIKDISWNKGPDFKFQKFESVAENLFKKDIDNHQKEEAEKFENNPLLADIENNSDTDNFGMESLESENPIKAEDDAPKISDCKDPELKKISKKKATTPEILDVSKEIKKL